MAHQRPLELILARNLLSTLSTPAFLADADGDIVFYNDAAAALIGVAFEERGTIHPGEWSPAIGPFDGDGRRIPLEELPISAALRSARPVHARYEIGSLAGDRHPVEANALPIAGAGGVAGAMLLFWPVGGPGQEDAS